MRIDRIWEFVQRFSPLTRSCLLTELERMEMCGIDMPGSADLQAKLRAELRPDGANDNTPTPSRYFFAPLDPLLVDGAPEHANSGRISRSSLIPIWEWISRDLLPMMARDYNEQMIPLIAANKTREPQQAAATFQSKVAKSLEGNLSSVAGAERARSRLAFYTASPSVYGDLVKMMGALRATEALTKFGAALPQSIRPGRQGHRVAGFFPQAEPQRRALCAGAGRRATEDAAGTDARRHQDRAQPQRRRRRRYALCNRHLDGAGPDRR
jgi:hypothetical protein